MYIVMEKMREFKRHEHHLSLNNEFVVFPTESDI